MNESQIITADDPFLGRCTISREGFAAAMRSRRFNRELEAERPIGDYWAEIRAWGVDPNFVLAMFLHESSFGVAGTAAITRSWGNTRTPTFGAIPIGEQAGRSGAFPRFAAWLDGCASTAARLASPVWPVGAPYGDRASIREVFDHPSGAVWAPAGDLNDPAGYLSSVVAAMNDWTDRAPEWIAAERLPTPATRSAYLSVNYSAGRFDDDGDAHAPRAIILHITAGASAASAVNWFSNPASGVSAHYVIDRDGTISACVAEEDTAWVNGVVEHPDQSIPIVDEWVRLGVNPNDETIGIEVAGYSATAPPPGAPADLIGYSSAQWASLLYLLPVLSERHAIPLTPDWLFGHRAISGVQRANCPGLSDAEWERLYAELAGVAGPPYATADAAYDAWCATTGDAVAWAGQIVGRAHWCGRDPQEVCRTAGGLILAYNGADAQDATGFALDEWEVIGETSGQLTVWGDQRNGAT